MKSHNTIWAQWLRRVSQLMTAVMVLVAFNGQASAQILFQDDDFHDIASEGLIINSDDGGDEDVTFQLGNDGTDGTITWDDGTATLTIGDGTDSVAVNSGSWDISAAGVASGFTGITSTGTIDFSGASRFAMHQGAADPGTCTEGDLFYNTTSNATKTCTATNTWTTLSSGSSDFEAVYGADAGNDLLVDDNSATAFTIGEAGNDYIVINTTNGSEAVEIGQTLTANGTLDANGVVTLGDNGDTVTIDSSDWDISATGDFTGAGAITADGLITGTAGATLSGAAISLNNNSNFAVNVGTGTSTGAVTVGGGSNTVEINSSTWDVSTAGAASGFTTIGASGNITTSGGDFVIGSTGLTETNGGGDNGATLIGVDQTEFANSSSTNVQDVLDDFDALIGSNAPNVDTMTFEAEYPNYALFADGSSNRGKMEVLYDSTNREQYYRWTTRQNADHDMDVRFRYTLPADYSSAGAMTIRLRNDTNVAGDNSLTVTVRNDTDNATCHSDGATTAAAANTWETVTITAGEIETGCTGGSALDPGDVIEVQLQLLADNTSSGGTDVGTLSFAYTN